jgi:hypothetical protein
MNMPTSGTVIRLFLVEGDAQGLRTAEVMNWTGQLVVGPRTLLKNLGQRPESRKTGVYILVGRDPEDFTSTMVYIGESDNVYDRLTSHNSDPKKDFWESTILVTSKDENLTKTDVRYLESRLIDTVSRANRAKLVNGTSPSPPPISEADMAVMDDFLERTRMVISVLGYDFLRTVEIRKETGIDETESPSFTLTARGVEAIAVETQGEFVVLRGATARATGVKSWATNRQLRHRLKESGVLVKKTDDGNFLALTEDTPFTSPSAAASVLTASNINGRIAWKNQATGQTYAEWQEQRLL